MHLQMFAINMPHLEVHLAQNRPLNLKDNSMKSLEKRIKGALLAACLCMGLLTKIGGNMRLFLFRYLLNGRKLVREKRLAPYLESLCFLTSISLAMTTNGLFKTKTTPCCNSQKSRSIINAKVDRGFLQTLWFLIDNHNK